MELQPLQLTRCPTCGQTAEIELRAVLPSTDGPIEHAKIRCIDRHWCFVPLHFLDPVPMITPPRHRAREPR